MSRGFYLVSLFVIACTKANPALCCENDAECNVIEFDSPQPCELGVCVANRCESSGCDGDEDCAGSLPYCAAGACVACDVNDACAPETPVCDQGTHECRRCLVDGDCASGACELSAGTCVEESSIRYVSPGGTVLDPCSPSSPCSLAHAFSTVDDGHRHVLMTPGSYTAGAVLTGKTAIVVGDQATLRVADAAGQISVQGQGSMSVRHLTVLTGPGPTEAIRCDQGSALDVSDLNVMGAGIAASSCRSLAVSDSTFTDGTVTFNNGDLDNVGVVIDRSRFFGRGPVVVGSTFFARITNSLVVARGSDSLRLRSLTTGSPTIESRVAYNTFVGGTVDCTNPGTPSGVNREFEGNIFVDLESPLPDASQCRYDYNLVMPPDFTLNGISNISLDPKFVDAVNGDYHLQAGSPAIDRGNPVSTEDHDIDNRPRPQGGRSDMGAFESL